MYMTRIICACAYMMITVYFLYSKYPLCNLSYPIHYILHDMVRSVIWEKSFRGYVDEMAIKRRLKEQDDTQRGII